MATYPSTEGLTEKYRAFEAEMRWWSDHHAGLLPLYPDEFVAVVDGKVVGHARDLTELRKVLEVQGVEFAADHTWIKFIDANPGRLLL